LWRSLTLVPVGSVDRDFVQGLIRELSSRVPLRVEVGSCVSLVECQAAGGQYLARSLLEILPSNGEEVTLGLTEADLCTPGRLYVFGQAAVGKGVGVVSLYRLLYAHHGWSPEKGLLMERVVKVALHEAGHAMGLLHCDGACVMRLCTSVYQIDGAPTWFCSSCKTKLGWPE